MANELRTPLRAIVLRGHASRGVCSAITTGIKYGNDADNNNEGKDDGDNNFRRSIFE